MLFFFCVEYIIYSFRVHMTLSQKVPVAQATLQLNGLQYNADTGLLFSLHGKRPQATAVSTQSLFNNQLQ